MEISCLVCSGTFEENDAAIETHFRKDHHKPVEAALMHYVIALQKQIEELKTTKT